MHQKENYCLVDFRGKDNDNGLHSDNLLNICFPHNDIYRNCQDVNYVYFVCYKDGIKDYYFCNTVKNTKIYVKKANGDENNNNVLIVDDYSNYSAENFEGKANMGNGVDTDERNHGHVANVAEDSNFVVTAQRRSEVDKHKIKVLSETVFDYKIIKKVY